MAISDSIRLCFFRVFFVLLVMQGESVFSQSLFRVMFYNVENLFDCKHDSLKSDQEFLPTSIRAWHIGRYKQKIKDIGKVITAIGEWSPPDLVGMCEVENVKVMDDLVNYSPLKEQDYRYVMTDSPDERGIDVALLYQRGTFRILQHRSIRIHFKEKERKPTRDILHVSGLVRTGDTLDVFVCHLPSRSGGEKESEPARLFAASVLKQATDSLFRIRMNPQILIMGDFNDYPDSRSIREVLKATAPSALPEQKKLYNLLAHLQDDSAQGSYKYQGEWGILDQLIVSGFLLQNNTGFSTSQTRARICNLPFLLEKDEKYTGVMPFRTYYGMKYKGGFSDHLPVILDFTFSE